MALFTKAENTQAYLKAGFMGFAGSGKTFTATKLSIGLVQMLRKLELPEGSKPVFFLDTETGSDYVHNQLQTANIEMHSAKTRSFADLVPAVREAEKNGSVLIIDSITHFWREFTEAYAKKRNRSRGLEFQDWAYLKAEWGKFTDAYINSSLHIIMCGRAGYEYDFFTNDNGKRELEKTGIKMKAETETGYEPSLLVLMERGMDMETRSVYREAHVLKERFDVIDGKVFQNPTFESFLPHIQLLNLGGHQLGVDTSRNSEGMIPKDGKSDWKREQEAKELIIERITALFIKHGVSSQSQDGKRQIIAAMEKHFNVPTWKEMELLPHEMVKHGYNSLHNELEGAPAYGVELPADSDVPDSVTKADAA